MNLSYDDALQALYQGSPAAFVAERKRLVNELKAGGDKEGAARLAKLSRPSVSVWAVNQLWWSERSAFEKLLSTADEVRRGDLAALTAHRRVLTTLRARASTLLTDSGHPPTEAVLRRVTTTLSALAASGGFEPDTPGALTSDREPLGFGEATELALPAAMEKAPAPKKAQEPKSAKEGGGAEGERERKAERDREAERERQREAERQKEEARRRKEREAERAKRAAALAALERAAEQSRTKVARIESELAEARQRLREAEDAASAAARKLAELGEED